jgi:hypothetical protein
MNSVYWVTGVFMLWFACRATLDQELFLQARNFYEKREYQKAHDQYALIKNKKYIVWFNLGNCAYHACNYPQAYAYWLRAYYDAPCAVQSELDSKYALLEQLCDGKKCALSFYERIIARISPLPVQVGALLFWVLLWWFIISGRWKKQQRVVSILGMFVLGFGILSYACYAYRVPMYAITSQAVNMYAGPNEQYHLVGHVDTMCKIRLYGQSDGWYKVGFGTSIGWVVDRDIVCV